MKLTFLTPKQAAEQELAAHGVAYTAQQKLAENIADLTQLLQAGSFHGTKTAKFAVGLIEQYQMHKNLSPKQVMWIRILLHRALLGPEKFPPVAVNGTLQPACMGCGGAVDEEGAKGVCKKCVRTFSKDG